MHPAPPHPAADPLAEFVEVRRGRAHALVRADVLVDAGVLGLAGAPAGEAGRVSGGRAPHPVVVLSDGGRAVVRRYRRGGALRHLNPDRYFLGHRAFAELRATERARRAGVRAPEVLAAVEHRRFPGYTALLATRWIDRGTELAGWLFRAPAVERAHALREVGRQVALVHAAGVGHPDLNLRNFLVVPGAGPVPEVHVLDFDRARLYPGPVPGPRRARDLRRLARSARKLRAPLDARAWAELRAGYGDAWPLASDLG